MSQSDGRNGALNANFLANSQKFKNSSLPAEVPPIWEGLSTSSCCCCHRHWWWHTVQDFGNEAHLFSKEFPIWGLNFLNQCFSLLWMWSVLSTTRRQQIDWLLHEICKEATTWQLQWWSIQNHLHRWRHQHWVWFPWCHDDFTQFWWWLGQQHVIKWNYGSFTGTGRCFHISITWSPWSVHHQWFYSAIIWQWMSTRSYFPDACWWMYCPYGTKHCNWGCTAGTLHDSLLSWSAVVYIQWDHCIHWMACQYYTPEGWYSSTSGYSNQANGR